MSRALPGQCRGDVAANRTARSSERRATARDAEAGRDEAPSPGADGACGGPSLRFCPCRPCCLRLWLQRLRPHTPPAAGPLRPGWRRAARCCGGAPICQAGACGDGGSAESPTTRLTRQRRRPHRDCAGPSRLSPRRCPIRPRRRWPPSARADKSSVAPDDQARAAQMGRIAALAVTRRRTAHTLS
jgi:hypothetical protein